MVYIRNLSYIPLNTQQNHVKTFSGLNGKTRMKEEREKQKNERANKYIRRCGKSS
jgi:hypothetical protein